jgi:hypothetical protein
MLGTRLKPVPVLDLNPCILLAPSHIRFVFIFDKLSLPHRLPRVLSEMFLSEINNIERHSWLYKYKNNR